MAYWGFVEKYLTKACIKGPGDFGPDVLREMCENGTSQLWIYREESGTVLATAVTTINADYKTGKKILEFTSVGGVDMATLDQCHDTIVAMAREEKNCVASRSICRLGMGKKLAKRGYRIVGYIMERPS